MKEVLPIERCGVLCSQPVVTKVLIPAQSKTGIPRGALWVLVEDVPSTPQVVAAIVKKSPGALLLHGFEELDTTLANVGDSLTHGTHWCVQINISIANTRGSELATDETSQTLHALVVVSLAQ